MSLAARTRESVREHPFLLAALRTGVVNYSAAAGFLDLDGDREAVAAALRRFADGLEPYATEARRARVTMQRGVGFANPDTDALLVVGGVGLRPEAGSMTALVATGDVDAVALGSVLGRVATEGIDVKAAAVAGNSGEAIEGDGETDTTEATLLVVVDSRQGAAALRAVEAGLDTVWTPG
ncbi:MAG: DUF7523 family protein [Halobacteriota archaeon]